MRRNQRQPGAVQAGETQFSMELEEGEITHQKECTSDSIQDLQSTRREMETEFSNAKTGEAVKDSASVMTIISNPLPGHKNAVMGVHEKEKHQKKSSELSSGAGPPVSSVIRHAKAMPSSDRAKVHTQSTQNSTGSKKIDLKPSIFGKSLQTMGSLSSITIPMRLDALAYLLNHAVLNPYNVVPQVSCFASQCNIATCRNVDTSLYGHIPLTCCPFQGTPPRAVNCPSVPTYLSQQHNTTNAIYPNYTGYHSDPLYSVQSQNYNYSCQAVVNQEIALNSDSRWEKVNSSPSITTTTKWDDTSRSMQTFGEISCTERRNSSFNQATSSCTRNDFRSTSVQGSSGNWRSSQNNDREWQDRNLSRPTGKFTDDSRTNYRRGDAGDGYKGSGFGRERSFGSDFRNRKRKEENSWPSGREMLSAPKQVRWSGNAESSGYQKTGQSMPQEDFGYMGEKSRHKVIESTEKGKTSIFARKQITSVEDWDAEYDTKPSKSSGHEEKSSRLKQTKCQNRPTCEDWETDYAEEKDSKQENPLQPEDKIINEGKGGIGELDETCQSPSLICVESSTSSEVSNIFKIMESDTATAATVGASGEAADTTDRHASSGPGESDICQLADSWNQLSSAEPFAKPVTDAMKTVKKDQHNTDKNKGHEEENPVMENVSSVTLISP